MTAEELLQRYAAGERDFSAIDLVGVSLARTNLNSINLTNANLIDVDLTEAKLVGADLTNARLTNVILTGTTLAGVNLTNVDLRSTINFDFSALMGNSLLWQTTLPDGTTIAEQIYTEE